MKGGEKSSGNPMLETRSVDQAEKVLSNALTTCRIRNVGAQKDFSLQVNGCAIGRTSLVHNRYGSHSIVDSTLPGDPVFFNLGSAQASTFKFGGRSVASGPSKPIIIANTNRIEIDRPKDSHITVLRAWIPDLEHQLETLTDRHQRGRLVFDQDAPLDHGAGAALSRLIGFLTTELKLGSMALSNPSFIRSYEEILLNALLALPHSHREHLFENRDHEFSPGLVARAQEYMRANLGEAITVSDLVRLCECSQSTLFSAFRNARGYSPMEFLTEERLQASRRMLLDPDATTSVTSVALDCGFQHLSRFSRHYRARFGELPSETLLRARGRR